MHQKHRPADAAQRADQPLDKAVMRLVRRFAGLVLQHADAIHHDVGAAVGDQLLQVRLVETGNRRLQRAFAEQIGLRRAEAARRRDHVIAAAKKIACDELPDQTAGAEDEQLAHRRHSPRSHPPVAKWRWPLGNLP